MEEGVRMLEIVYISSYVLQTITRVQHFIEAVRTTGDAYMRYEPFCHFPWEYGGGGGGGGGMGEVSLGEGWHC